jgi:hypothetical protein
MRTSSGAAVWRWKANRTANLFARAPYPPRRT